MNIRSIQNRLFAGVTCALAMGASAAFAQVTPAQPPQIVVRAAKMIDVKAGTVVANIKHRPAEPGRASAGAAEAVSRPGGVFPSGLAGFEE